MSASDSSKDSDTPKKLPHEDLFDSIRRFTDQHISSVLHSLIGLPSILAPPNPGTWTMDEEDSNPTGTRTPRQRSLSEGSSSTTVSIVEEVRKLNNGSGKGSNGGVPFSGDRGRAEINSISDVGSKSLWSIWGPGETFPLERIVLGELGLRNFWPRKIWEEGWESDSWKVFGFDGARRLREEMERMEKELLREFEKAPTSTSGELETDKRLPSPEIAEGSNEETELDMYQLLTPPQKSRLFSSEGTEAGKKPRVISEISEKRSYMGPDGVTRTKYVSKKRFEDGTEEKLERVYSNATKGLPERIELIREELPKRS
ncbi:hypothetical protein RUND412_010181 [Rhizina undulata]